MSDSQIELPALSTIVEPRGDCVRRVVITIEAREAKRFKKRCRKMGMTSDGQVIDALVRLLCTTTVPQEAVPMSYGYPQGVGERPSLNEGRPLVITLDVDVSPVIETPDLSSVDLLVPDVSVAPSDIEAEFLEQRRLAGTRSDLVGPLEIGDSVQLAVTLTCEEDSQAFVENHPVEITVTDRTLRLSIDNLEVTLAPDDFPGRSVGDTLDQTIDVPDDAVRLDLGGQRVSVAIRIDSAQRVVPATAEDVVKAYEAPSEANLRIQIETALQNVNESNRQNAARQQALVALAELMPFELPPFSLAESVRGVLERITKHLAQRGYLTEASQKPLIQNMRSRIEAAAAISLRTELIARTIYSSEGIHYDPEHLNKEIARQAQLSGRRPAELRAELLKNDDIGRIERICQINAAADWVLKHVQIREVPIEDFTRDRVRLTG